MALKKRNKIEASFSMASMTDIIFLLLLFFVMSSTMSSPNDIKINLPQSKARTATKAVVAKVSINEQGQYFVAIGKGKSQAIVPEQLESYLMNLVAQDSTTYIALNADQNIPYKNVVYVLDIANQHKLKIVIATQSAEKK